MICQKWWDQSLHVPRRSGGLGLYRKTKSRHPPWHLGWKMSLAVCEALHKVISIIRLRIHFLNKSSFANYVYNKCINTIYGIWLACSLLEPSPCYNYSYLDVYIIKIKCNLTFLWNSFWYAEGKSTQNRNETGQAMLLICINYKLSADRQLVSAERKLRHSE